MCFKTIVAFILFDAHIIQFLADGSDFKIGSWLSWLNFIVFGFIQFKI